MADDKNWIPPLWSMSSTEDLLRFMWEQGKFQYECPGDQFDLNCAQKAMESFWQLELKVLYSSGIPNSFTEWEPDRARSGLGENARATITDPREAQVVIDFINVPYADLDEFLTLQEPPAPSSSVVFDLSEYLASTQTRFTDSLDLVNLYLNAAPVFAIGHDPKAYQDALGLAQTYAYLSALERGEPLPFSLPPFNPNEISDRAASLLYSGESPEEHAERLVNFVASLFSDFGALEHVNKYSELYPLWQALHQLPEGTPGKPDEQMIAEYLRTALGDNYTAINVAQWAQETEIAMLSALQSNYYMDAAGNILVDDEMPWVDPTGAPEALEGRLQGALAFNTIYLQALQADAMRQIAYSWRPLLTQLDQEIRGMPDEVISVSVTHIKQGFEDFYQAMNSLVGPEAMYALEQIWEQQFKELGEDPTDNLVPLILIGSGFWFSAWATILAGPELASTVNAGVQTLQGAYTGNPVDLLFAGMSNLDALYDITALGIVDYKVLVTPDQIEDINLWTNPDLLTNPGAMKLSWRVKNEVADPNAIKQAEQWSCQLACAEMIARDRGVTIPQQTLMKIFGVAPQPQDLAAALNTLDPTDAVTWKGGIFEGASEEELFNYFNAKAQGSWGAILTEPGMRPHMVVIDGLEEGEILIRDPWGLSTEFAENSTGSRYTMEEEEFFRLFVGGGLWRE